MCSFYSSFPTQSTSFASFSFSVNALHFPDILYSWIFFPLDVECYTNILLSSETFLKSIGDLYKIYRRPFCNLSETYLKSIGAYLKSFGYRFEIFRRPIWNLSETYLKSVRDHIWNLMETFLKSFGDLSEIFRRHIWNCMWTHFTQFLT